MEENKELDQLETENTVKVKGLLTEDQIKKKKSRKTKTAISVFVLLLAVGLGGNWYWENSDISSKISTIAASNKTLGEATFVDARRKVIIFPPQELTGRKRMIRHLKNCSRL